MLQARKCKVPSSTLQIADLELETWNLEPETAPMPWSTETAAGHPCDVYLPPERNQHGYAVLYLHGVHSSRLDDKPAFIEQFDRHGLAVVCPQTKRSWWTDKICHEF